jgi:hypothetical protein
LAAAGPRADAGTEESTMNGPKGQAGLSAIGWLFLLLIVGGGFSVVSSLVPHYWDHNILARIITDMGREPGLVSQPTETIAAMVEKRLEMNNVRGFGLKEKMKVKRADDRVIIDVQYEVREPFFHNIYFVMVFAEQVDLRD